MSFAGLLHGLDDRFVDAERDGDTEQGQQQVGDHADHAKRCQRKQQQQRHAKHHTWLLRVPPVHQVIHCMTERVSENRVRGVFPWMLHDIEIVTKLTKWIVELVQNTLNPEPAAVKGSNTLFEWVLFLYLNCKIIRSLINNMELIFSIWLWLCNAVSEWLVIWRERNLLKKPYIKGILHVERCLQGVRLCAFPFLRKSRTHKVFQTWHFIRRMHNFVPYKNRIIHPYIFSWQRLCFQNTVLLEEEFQHGHVWGRVL